jgi:hypothetical protein
MNLEIVISLTVLLVDALVDLVGREGVSEVLGDLKLEFDGDFARVGAVCSVNVGGREGGREVGGFVVVGFVAVSLL